MIVNGYEIEPGADLRDADLRGADLHDAKLQYAKLQGADLRDAKLQGAKLQCADLRDAKLQGAKLRDADLRGAKLRGAYLRDADLWGAKLQGAYLQGADLRDADLRGAYLRGEETIESYAQTLSALLTAGGRSIETMRKSLAVQCHDWTNCPMAYAFTVSSLDEIPAEWRDQASRFVSLYDRGLIRLDIPQIEEALR